FAVTADAAARKRGDCSHRNDRGGAFVPCSGVGAWRDPAMGRMGRRSQFLKGLEPMIDANAPVEVFDEIDSTILEARRRAKRGELNPVWLVAKRQTAGRGRRGRAWSSLNGNLLATLLFTTKEPPSTIALLGFATGVALAETLEAIIGGGRATLKWPNDV